MESLVTILAIYYCCKALLWCARGSWLHFSTADICRFNPGNIVGSDNVQIDINKIISTENVLLSLNNFLLTNKRYLIKECLWLLANIFARRELSITDNLKEIQVIISNVKRHLNSAYEIKKEVRRDLSWLNVLSVNWIVMAIMIHN